MDNKKIKTIMNSSFKGRFFPNECYICKSRENLRRCFCNMISYCSKEHRLKHLPVHETFCKTVQKVLKEKKISHINEKFIAGEKLWKETSEDIIEFEKKLERCMTPLELSMWIRPRVCFACNNSKGYLKNCTDCPIASFCSLHNYNDAGHYRTCQLMNRYLKTLSVAEELDIDMQFLPSCFPYITEERFEFLDPLTYTGYNECYESQYTESISTKDELINFINIVTKLIVALGKIYDDTVPDEIVLHIDSFTNDHAIINANYWEFFLHVNPVRNLKIVITGNKILKSNLENYSLCENCVSSERTLSVEKCTLTYEDYMLQDNYQVPDVLFYFRIEYDRNFEKANKWNEIGCPVISLMVSNSIISAEQPYFLLFLIANFRIIFNGEIETFFDDVDEIKRDNYFIIFRSKSIKKQEISPADNSSENDDTSLNSTKDDSILIENNNEKVCEEKIAEDNSSNKGAPASEIEKQNLKTISPSSSFSSFTIVSEHEEGDNNVEKNVNDNNSKADDDLESHCKENETLSKDNESLFTENSSLKTENEKLQHKLSSSLDEVAKLQQKLNSSTDEVAKLQQELNSSTNEVKKLQQELNSSTNEVTKLQQELNSSTDEVAKLQKKIVKFEKNGFQLNEKIQSIDEIVQKLKMETSLQIENENS
ncbi:suppressor of Mek1-like [Leptopilina heterotoma]|uniref:suppressor of Mek1-like n=1 Tax=Leptopilina heterotoma TaxID=63436 RepID=UPI001CA905B8|nr:suppressor of Mek1-like [Leptopilina heterotoma]